MRFGSVYFSYFILVSSVNVECIQNKKHSIDHGTGIGIQWSAKHKYFDSIVFHLIKSWIYLVRPILCTFTLFLFKFSLPYYFRWVHWFSLCKFIHMFYHFDGVSDTYNKKNVYFANSKTNRALLLTLAIFSFYPCCSWYSCLTIHCMFLSKQITY